GRIGLLVAPLRGVASGGIEQHRRVGEPPVAVARDAHAGERLLAAARIAKREAQPRIEQRSRLARPRRADEHVPRQLRHGAPLALGAAEARLAQHDERFLEALAKQLDLARGALRRVGAERAADQAVEQALVLACRLARAPELPGEPGGAHHHDRDNAGRRALEGAPASQAHHVARKPQRDREREPRARADREPSRQQALHDPLLSTIATRRFLARLAGVSLAATGSESASPSARSRAGFLSSAAISATTERARSV